MITMTSIFNADASEYIERYPNLPPSHLKTIRAICACRTGAYGYSLYTCPSWGQPHRIDHAGGNRHCPQCQHPPTQLWLQHQLDKQVPGPHFLITFTIPEPLRAFCRSPPRLAYQSLFQASSEALKKLARDERLIGTDLPGLTGVLHTWGRQLQYHPLSPTSSQAVDSPSRAIHGDLQTPSSMFPSEPSRQSTEPSSKPRSPKPAISTPLRHRSGRPPARSTARRLQGPRPP